MLRERDSRVAAPEDVLATLAELDAKLEALERGMAAAQVTAAGGRIGGEGQPATSRAASPQQGVVGDSHHHDVVADFQAAARSRTERGLWRRAIAEASGQLEGIAEASGDPGSAVIAEQQTPLVDEPDVAAEVRPRHPDRPAAGDADGAGWAAAPDGLEPAGAVGAAADAPAPRAYVAVPGHQLSDWRERLGRAVGELTSLQAEIGTAALGVLRPGDPVGSGPDEPTVGPFSALEPGGLPTGPPSSTGTPANGQVHGGRPPIGAATPGGVPPGVGARLPVPMPHDRIFEGRVLVDAGPFVDIAGVASFQRALELVPGASAVDVTALELDRAHLELELSDPVALGREIRAVFPFNFAIFEAGRGRLSINVDASSLTAPQLGPGTR